MSRENVEVVRGLYEGWARGDFRIGLEAFDPETEFVVDGSVSPTPGEWRGLDGIRDYWREQLVEWENYRTGAIEHLLESGEHVVAFNRMHGRGKRSGADAESRLWAAVFRFRDSKITRMQITDIRGALEAVGLRE